MPKEKFLTNRQKKFCELIMEGIYSNSECARRSGYSHGQANRTASLLLNGKDFPLVTQHLKELREVREKKYGVTLMGQLKRLSDLSRGAEEDGQFSASINAEKIRSALGGLSTDNRQNTIVHQLDKLSRDEIVARLSEIRKQYPSAFIEGDYKIVGSNKGEDKITSDLGDNTSS